MRDKRFRVSSVLHVAISALDVEICTFVITVNNTVLYWTAGSVLEQVTGK